MKTTKLTIITVLLIIISLNIFGVIFQDNPYTQAKILMTSSSVGDRYFGRLTLWNLYAQNGDWQNAIKLESQLNPVDIQSYKLTHYPLELKKSVNSLVIKPNKTVEDWLELARVDSILDKKIESFDAIAKAKALDPIRDDISRLYYQSVK